MQRELPAFPGAFAVPSGPYMNTVGQVVSVMPSAHGAELTTFAPNEARVPSRRIEAGTTVRVFRYPGCTPDQVCGYLLHYAVTSQQLSASGRLSLILSCLESLFPVAYAAVEGTNGLTIRREDAPASTITGITTGAGWPTAQTPNYNVPFAHTTVEATSVREARAYIGVILWGSIRQVVARNPDAHIARRHTALTSILGERIEADNLGGLNRFPSINDWIELNKAFDSAVFMRRAIMQRACEIAFAEETAATIEFAAHVRLLAEYGLGDFRAILMFGTQCQRIINDNSMLATGLKEFVEKSYRPWKAQSPFDRLYKKAILGSVYTPLGNLENRAIRPAARLFMKVISPAQANIEVRGLPPAILQYLTEKFLEQSIGNVAA